MRNCKYLRTFEGQTFEGIYKTKTQLKRTYLNNKETIWGKVNYIMFDEFNVTPLHPIQQPESCWDRPSVLPVLGNQPT